MAKRNRIEAIHGELILPEEIIQHIQSFLTGKEAAQTAVLSKSWKSAWLTRPDLDFDQRNFKISGVYDRERFNEFAKNTIQRYQKRKLKIESCSMFVKDFSVGEELIAKAVKMGVVDLHFEAASTTENFVLPQEVLESKNLVRLSVTGCQIEGKVNWPSLESLCLCKVCVEGEMISDILSSSPLIAKLVLSDCKFLVKFQSPNLVTSTASMVALKYSLINVYVFRNLMFLCLEQLNISSSFFSDFSSKFPCMKGLAVSHCFGYTKGIKIDSPSLKYIHFAHKLILRATFDVPSIRRFSFLGKIVPCLSFGRASREWESDISITWKGFRTSWFVGLNKFLRTLSQSIITLSLDLGHMKEEEIFGFPRDTRLPKPVVESLEIGVRSSISPAVMDALFWSFHPKSIFPLWMPLPDTTVEQNNELLKLLCKTLIQEGNEDSCIPNRNARALRHLEGVNVDVFKDSLGEFEPQPWKMMLNAMELLDATVFSKRRIRFKLQWGTD